MREGHFADIELHRSRGPSELKILIIINLHANFHDRGVGERVLNVQFLFDAELTNAKLLSRNLKGTQPCRRVFVFVFAHACVCACSMDMVMDMLTSMTMTKTISMALHDHP